MSEPEPHIAGWRVARFASLGSTNDEARTRALAGDPGGLWVVAEEQTQGRGRQGRVWRSPRGNLYASVLLVDPCEAAIAPQLGFVAGVALVNAARDLGAADAAIKWPNDLLWQGAKLSGLLVEGLTIPGRRFVCVIGFGVNCVSSPEGLTYPVADLGRALARPVSPAEVFAALAARFDEMFRLWDRGGRFADIRTRWLAAAAGLGGPARVASARGTREGLFEGLDPSGRLLLRTPSGLEAVEAADLFLTPPMDAQVADESRN
ncbi:MAG: biotin--[acetyl-CoA-carboxylase] ligase [Hyphomicrobiales bacterium]|nr:biotin--[acetyl-CoA-carboxylase] ligase [Hyphomicrobiales bacterium]MBV8662299.1 biotin--[acetyl-CoA-carboxylase] ligase [Hyphomicrobiales bacterium]